MSRRLVALVLLAGCVDPPAPPPLSEGAAPDASLAVPDAARWPRDAAETNDADGRDGPCEATARIELGREVGRRVIPVSAAGSSDGLVVSWARRVGARVDVVAVRLGEDDAPIATALTDDDATEEAPVLARVGATLEVAWTDDAAGTRDLSLRALHRDVVSVRPLPPDATLRRDHVALASGPAGTALAFAETDRAGAARIGWQRLEGHSGRAIGPTWRSEVSAGGLGRPSLAVSRSGMWLAWTTPEGALSVRGPELDTPVTALVPAELAVREVSLASSESDVGLLVVGASVAGRSELFVRTFATDDGSPRGPLRSLSGASGGGASAAAWGGGFVVAFRATDGALRAVWLDASGEPVAERVLDSAADADPPSVAVGLDGSVLVAWSEREGDETTTWARRLRCDAR